MNELLQSQMVSGRVYAPDRNQLTQFAGKNGFNWVEDEVYYASNPQTGGVKSLPLPRELLTRRLYFFAELSLSTPTADYLWQARLVFSNGQRPVGELPVNLAYNATGSYIIKTRASLILNGVAANNPAHIAIFNPFTGGQTGVDLTPFEMRCEADSVTLFVDSFSVASGTFDGYRAFMGVLSYL
jgi:hypothetical protein